MGSFNVKCGITNLSISCGEDCLLLPLITKKFYKGIIPMRKNYVTQETTSLFVYNDDMWEPFCMPIRGTYDDYGSIENIIKNDNTRKLEDFFKMSIEDLVSLFTETRRDVYDRFSKFNEIFYLYPNDLEYKASLETFLIHLGFVKKENIYTLNDCQVEINDNELVVKLNEKEKTFEDKEDFLKWYQKETNDFLGIKNKEIYETLICVGGMFILGDIYDFYATNHLPKNANIVNKFNMSRFVLIDNDFKTENYKIFTKNVNGVDLEIKYESEYSIKFNEETVYDMEDFMERYKTLTKEDFDVSKYNGLDSYDFDELEQKTIPLKVFKKYYNVFFTNPIDLDWNNEEDVKNLISSKITSKNLVFMSNDIMPNIGFINKYDTMKEIYLKEFLLGNLLSEYTKFRRLLVAMNLTNIMFIPSFCGTQCGCNEAEVQYAYIINQIVEKRQAQLEQEDEDFKKVNPLEGFNERFY